MKKPEQKAYMRRTRATWLQEKLDINYAKANAIVTGLMRATPMEEMKISEAIRKDMRAPLHQPKKK